MSSTRAIAALLAFALGAASCSSDSSAVATVTGETVAPPETTVAPAPTEPPTTTAPSTTTQWSRPEPVFTPLPDGCYSTPAYEADAANMGALPPRWSGLATTPSFDLNGDGVADELYSLGAQRGYGFDGHVQAFLGEDLGWSDLLAEFPAFVFTIEAVADLDADGADEVLLSHQGNNFASIVLIDLDGCDLRLAQHPVFAAEKHFNLYCSSNSCLGETVRLDCVGNPGDHRMREHLITVVPDQVDAYRWDGLESPDWQYTIRDSRLVEGVLEVVAEVAQVVPSEDPLPARWDHDHFLETCWD